LLVLVLVDTCDVRDAGCGAGTGRRAGGGPVVSRTSMRVALFRLVAQGLSWLRPNVGRRLAPGSFVLELSQIGETGQAW
jgi:hypothetical protein